MEIALYHTLGRLPEPESTHSFRLGKAKTEQLVYVTFVFACSCGFCANRKACEGSVRPKSLRPELDPVPVQTLRRRSASCAFMT